MDPFESVHLPIDGSLDLHAFSPKDLRTLLPDYLEECRQRGIFQVRIIHGKGRGELRRSVQAILGRLECVLSFRPAGPDGGAWGATIVDLAPLRGNE
jgi:DNA-nicking Smr family endonuclease